MVEHYNKRIQNIIQKELFKAKDSIKIAVAWFTNELLFEPLLLKLQTGVTVELVLNKDEINNSEENDIDFSEFIDNGGVLHWNDSSKLMHEKFCIIDDNIVIYGTYNWTNKAEFNDESIAVSRDEKNTSDFYLDTFKKLCAKYPTEIKIEEDIFSTEISEQERKEAVTDEDGALYTKDWKKLIQGPSFKEEYKIKEGTLIIGDGAFSELEYGNNFLNSITIPNSVKSIGKKSFQFQPIKQLIIPDSVKLIGDSAFAFCEDLTHVTIGVGVTEIGNCAFESCYSLQSVVIVSNILKSIGERAFFGCGKLNHINIPKCVQSIGGGIFNGAKCNPIVDFNHSNFYIKEEALYSKQGYVISCWSKKPKIAIPNNTKQIYNYAFSSCIFLQFIEIPNSVTRIGNNAFHDCRRLLQVYVPNGIEKIEPNTFSGCLSLRTVQLPMSVYSIGQHAFGGCWKLEDINIPIKVTYIGYCAFSSCKSLDSIVIPRSAKTIESNAFSDMDCISSIVFQGCVDNIGDNIFGDPKNPWGCPYPRKIIIPQGTKNKYKKIFYKYCDIIEK